MRQNIPQADKLEQPQEGSANEDHFAITNRDPFCNHKYTRNENGCMHGSWLLHVSSICACAYCRCVHSWKQRGKGVTEEEERKRVSSCMWCVVYVIHDCGTSLQSGGCLWCCLMSTLSVCCLDRICCTEILAYGKLD